MNDANGLADSTAERAFSPPASSAFDEKLWLTVIDMVTVHTDGRLTFNFQGGTEIDA
ncbi:MAG: hypothetical protein ACI4II_05545 [Acutalibacteraceae bacterium]